MEQKTKITLQSEIKERGMIQKAIAERAGLSVSMFNAIVNGEKEPTGPQKALIIYAFNELAAGGPYTVEDFWPTKKIRVKK